MSMILPNCHGFLKIVLAICQISNFLSKITQNLVIWQNGYIFLMTRYLVIGNFYVVLLFQANKNFNKSFFLVVKDRI